MNEIIRGTTPTITFSFSSVRPSDIAVAYLTITGLYSDLVIERELDSATVASDGISWTLTQEETLLLDVGMTVKVLCDWRLSDGTRGRSKAATYMVGETAKNEVI